jgi:hypothetical protein
MLEEPHYLGVRADHVCHLQEREPHFRRDVVGDRLRERISRVLLAEPGLESLVEPPRGLDRHPEHVMALRVEQVPTQLLEVRQDEVEQVRSGLCLDVTLQRRDRGLGACGQLGDDRRIDLDGRERRGGRHGMRRLVRGRWEAVATFEERLERVTDQRIGFREALHQARAAGRGRQVSTHIDEQPTTRGVHGRASRE